MTWVRMALSSVAGARGLNEDAVSTGFVPGRGIFAVVADGMGGHAAGEVASRMACETIAKALGTGAGLQEAVAAANHEVWRSAMDHQGRKGMGTTVVAAWVGNDGQRHVANVGDSRAYRIDVGGIQQITTDHSFVNDAVVQGKMSREEAERSRWRNALSRTIGSEKEVEVDVFGLGSAGEPHFLVLCSDGVTQTIDDGLMSAVVKQSTDVNEAAETLTQLAVARGSDDNASVAVLEFGEFDREPRDFTQPIPPPLPDEAEPALLLDSNPEMHLQASQRSFLRRRAGPVLLALILVLALGFAIQRGVFHLEPADPVIESPSEVGQPETVEDPPGVEDQSDHLAPEQDVSPDTTDPPTGEDAADTLLSEGALP